MAEIGLVASIFSVAAVGTSVATSLYEAADVVVHAPRQILALAKHVSQSTSVLKHMGKVLETEKANCSREVLRDIRKIENSCQRTFKEIKSTFKSKSKRFRQFNPVRWFFKRSKALELVARLESQQSMLQCIIHTLTVSKLGKLDSRSKQDSADVKEEIKLLKTFIMENYNNLTELKYAEQVAEAEARDQPASMGGIPPGIHVPYGDSGNNVLNPIGRPNSYEPPMARAPSTNSSDSGSESEGAMSDDGAIAKDVDHLPFKDESDQEDIDPTAVSNAKPSSYNALDPRAHRESELLLQMVPYTPNNYGPGRHNLLISSGQAPSSGKKSAAEEAIESVRLLLDKCTTSGSAPVSNILDEEAATAKNTADRTDYPDFQSGAYQRYPSSAAYLNESGFGHIPIPDDYNHPPYSQNIDIPPPPQYGYPSLGNLGSRQKDFWKPSHPIIQSPDGHLGDAILNALRSTRGGIYYTKSNDVKQVHYVDHFPIFTCVFVPPHMVPYNEWKFLKTELHKGTIRREALDLLGYSYSEVGAEKFSISGDLELTEIKELVKLSYQALDRYCKERCKAIIEEKGLGGAIDAMNSRRPEMHGKVPFAPPRYPSPVPETWDQNIPHIRHAEYPLYAGYRDTWPDSRASFERARPPGIFPYSSATRPARPSPISPHATRVDSQEEKSTAATRPELRFTLPKAQHTIDITRTAKDAQPSQAKADKAANNADDEIQKTRQRIAQLKKKQEEAENAKDLMTASDIKYYAIPDLEVRLAKLLVQQHKEDAQQESPKKEDLKKSHHAEIDTESEDDDDKGDSEIEVVRDYIWGAVNACSR